MNPPHEAGDALGAGEPPRWSWGEIAMLALIIAVGAFLRFYRIAEHSFWVDELFTIESVNGTGLAGTFDIPVNVVLDPAPAPTTEMPVRPWWHVLRPDRHD